VLAPLAVDDVEQHVAFQLPHRTLAGDFLELGFPCGISTFGVFDQRIEQLVVGELVAVGVGVRVSQVLVGDPRPGTAS